MITRDCTYAGTPPPLILRRAQHERPCPARGFRIGVGNDGREWDGFQPGSGNGGSKRQVSGQVLDPSRGLGMTGGGGWGRSHGIALTWGPPLILREPQHERPRPWGWLHGIGVLTTRGFGMTGGWGVGGGVMTRDRYYVGTPRSYFDGLSASGPALGDGASRYGRILQRWMFHFQGGVSR